MAWMLCKTEATANRMYARQKQELLKGLSGTILEIGPGSGINMEFYAPGATWIGVEPNPASLPHLHQKAAALNLKAEVKHGYAEALDAPDSSVDYVVSTLVLCSVTSVEQTLREIKRVLKPGGKFIFIEHVAAPADTMTRSAQRLLNPLWRKIADGCHPDRETWRLLKDAEFGELKFRRFKMQGALPIMAPHIMGTATKVA